MTTKPHSPAIAASALEITGKTPKKNKKEAQLIVRLEPQLRDEFIQACQAIDSPASREIRKFIKQFLKKYHAGELE